MPWGDLQSHGAPFGLCGRRALERAIAAWQEHGLTPLVGIELEAYVFAKNNQDNWEPYDTPGAFVYGAAPPTIPPVLWTCCGTPPLPATCRLNR